MVASIPERLASYLIGLHQDQLAYRHGPAFPTIAELVMHFTESGEAFDRLLTEALAEDPKQLSVPVTDSGSILNAAVAIGSRAVDPDAIVEGLNRYAASRRELAELIRQADEATWQRPVHDAFLGEVTPQQLVGRLAQHEMGHISQLRNLIACLPEIRLPAPAEPEEVPTSSGRRRRRRRSGARGGRPGATPGGVGPATEGG